MKAVGRYDSALQMFVEETREPDVRRLKFLRWLGENNRLEHPLAGPASGELVVASAEAEVAGLPFASGVSRFKDRATKFTADTGGWLKDGVSPEVRSEMVMHLRRPGKELF